MYQKGTITCLCYGIFNLSNLFVCIGLALTLVLDKSLSLNIAEVVKGYALYGHIIYTILLNILGLFITGEFTNLVMKRSFDRKSFYTKLKIMACLLVCNLVGGTVLIFRLLANYIKTKELCVRNASIVLSSIAVLNFLLYLCVHMLHPDIWHLKRRRELNEMINQVALS